MSERTLPQLLAPAGNFEALSAALNAGADAVYFGVGSLNMRAGATVNFTEDDLPQVVQCCHDAGAKAYLTVNTILYDEELDAARALCDRAKICGVDACIAGDPGILAYLQKIGMPIHLTVQCNVCNLESVRFYAQFADVMVLARELNLFQIRHIVNGIRKENICGPSGTPVKIELFIHGALCIGIAGKCGMSLALYNRSASRGLCVQPCRRKYTVRDAESGAELAIDNEYVMSPKDLCTLPFLDQILDSGVELLKIEGRARSADYVSTVVSAYKTMRDSWVEHKFTRELADSLVEKLRTVFNRDFWMGGYYLGNPLETWSGAGGSQASIRKTHLGRITNYFAKIGVAEMKIETDDRIRPGDKILISGNTTGSVEATIREMRTDSGPVREAVRGDVIAFEVPEKVRMNDRVQLLRDLTQIQ